MGRKPMISREAIYDLDEIWDYITKDNLPAADRFVEELFEKCREIATLDAVGRKRDELHPGLLSLSHKRYVIFFQRKDSQVSIVRILHGARDMGTLFSG